MEYSLRVATEPAFEPVSRTEAKLHLRIESAVTDDDLLIDALVKAAREWCENYTRRSYVSRTLELRMDCFPDQILLPRGPVLSIGSVKYLDQGGTLTTLDPANYQTDLYSVPGRIRPPFGSVWPVPKLGTVNAVVVTYDAGYVVGSPSDQAAAAESVPASLKAAIKLMVGHWYENREQVVVGNVQPAQLPMAVSALLAPLEIRHFGLE